MVVGFAVVFLCETGFLGFGAVGSATVGFALGLGLGWGGSSCAIKPSVQTISNNSTGVR